MEQVVLNLVTNAVEASALDGEITIRTGRQTLTNVENDSSLYGKRTTGGEFSYIEVVDSGSGISGQDLERIFEPFFSNSEIGRGLGLSVVYGAVSSHDGFIKCNSDIGQGTEFRVLIPHSSDSIDEPELFDEFPRRSEFADNLSKQQGGRKILVIDDEESVLELCAQMLQLDGWEVITAVGGERGLELAEQFSQELTCILLDVVMPELGASELLREMEIREILIPVVLMSGFSQTRLEFFLEREQVVSIVQKPFRASDITRAVQAAAKPGVPTEFATTATGHNAELPR
jgi:CheY-like chemotaxis protein